VKHHQYPSNRSSLKLREAPVTTHRVPLILFLAFAPILLAAGVVWGNAPIFQPTLDVRGAAQVRFEDIDKYPEQAFYLRYWVGEDDNHLTEIIVEVKDAKPVTLNAKNGMMCSAALVLAFDNQRAKDDPELKFLDDPTQEIGRQYIRLPIKQQPKEGALTTYRVRLKDGELTVEAVDATWTAPRVWALSLVGALCVAGLGLWLARRRRTVRATRENNGTEAEAGRSVDTGSGPL
jgi:hypothetical protein